MANLDTETRVARLRALAEFIKKIPSQTFHMDLTWAKHLTVGPMGCALGHIVNQGFLQQYGYNFTMKLEDLKPYERDTDEWDIDLEENLEIKVALEELYCNEAYDLIFAPYGFSEFDPDYLGIDQADLARLGQNRSFGPFIYPYDIVDPAILQWIGTEHQALTVHRIGCVINGMIDQLDI